MPRRHENPAIICTGFTVSGWSTAKPYVFFIAIDLAPALRCYGILTAKMPHIDWLTAVGIPMRKKYIVLLSTDV